MTTKTEEKTSLEIKRFINAPRDRVYTAWTDPVQLKEWWGPKEVTTLKFVADTRVDGKYRWDLVNQEGEKMSVFGEYRSSFPERRSFSPGNGMTTKRGRTTPASYRSNFPIATAERSCD